MHHAGLQYGQGSIHHPAAAHHLQYSGPQPPPTDLSVATSLASSSTASLRQWRKKDFANDLAKPTIHETNQSNDIQGPIARVAPHAHYPRTSDHYRYQYPDFSLTFKDLTSTPVKYSEIVEPTLPSATHLLQKPKENDYYDMCGGLQQQQLIHHQPQPIQQQSKQQPASHIQQQQHQQQQQQQQQKYLQHYYKLPNQYQRHLSYAQSTANECNYNPLQLFNEQQQYYHHQHQQQQQQQQQRTLYRPQSYQPYKPNFHQKLHHFDYLSSRRFYNENYQHPSYATCQQQMEYAQHYQRRHDYPSSVSAAVNLQTAAAHQQAGLAQASQAHDLAGKSSLKTFLETWKDDLQGDPEAAKESLYILDATEIPHDSVQQFIHLQVDKLPDNVKGYLSSTSPQPRTPSTVSSADNVNGYMNSKSPPTPSASSSTDNVKGYMNSKSPPTPSAASSTDNVKSYMNTKSPPTPSVATSSDNVKGYINTKSPPTPSVASSTVITKQESVIKENSAITETKKFLDVEKVPEQSSVIVLANKSRVDVDTMTDNLPALPKHVAPSLDRPRNENLPKANDDVQKDDAQKDDVVDEEEEEEEEEECGKAVIVNDNFVLLQIAGQMLEINVINVDDKKMVSVVPLTDCCIVTETNNNSIAAQPAVKEDDTPKEEDNKTKKENDLIADDDDDGVVASCDISKNDDMSVSENENDLSKTVEERIVDNGAPNVIAEIIDSENEIEDVIAVNEIVAIDPVVEDLLETIEESVDDDVLEIIEDTVKTNEEILDKTESADDLEPIQAEEIFEIEETIKTSVETEESMETEKSLETEKSTEAEKPLQTEESLETVASVETIETNLLKTIDVEEAIAVETIEEAIAVETVEEAITVETVEEAIAVETVEEVAKDISLETIKDDVIIDLETNELLPEEFHEIETIDDHIFDIGEQCEIGTSEGETISLTGDVTSDEVMSEEEEETKEHVEKTTELIHKRKEIIEKTKEIAIKELKIFITKEDRERVDVYLSMKRQKEEDATSAPMNKSKMNFSIQSKSKKVTTIIKQTMRNKRFTKLLEETEKLETMKKIKTKAELKETTLLSDAAPIVKSSSISLSSSSSSSSSSSPLKISKKQLLEDETKPKRLSLEEYKRKRGDSVLPTSHSIKNLIKTKACPIEDYETFLEAELDRVIDIPKLSETKFKNIFCLENQAPSMDECQTKADDLVVNDQGNRLSDPRLRKKRPSADLERRTSLEARMESDDRKSLESVQNNLETNELQPGTKSTCLETKQSSPNNLDSGIEDNLAVKNRPDDVNVLIDVLGSKSSDQNNFDTLDAKIASNSEIPIRDISGKMHDRHSPEQPQAVSDILTAKTMECNNLDKSDFNCSTKSDLSTESAETFHESRHLFDQTKSPRIDDLNKKIDDLFAVTFTKRKSEDELLRRFNNRDYLSHEEIDRVLGIIKRKRFEQDSKFSINLDELTARMRKSNRKRPMIDPDDFNLGPELERPKMIIDLNELLPPPPIIHCSTNNKCVINEEEREDREDVPKNSQIVSHIDKLLEDNEDEHAQSFKEDEIREEDSKLSNNDKQAFLEEEDDGVQLCNEDSFKKIYEKDELIKEDKLVIENNDDSNVIDKKLNVLFGDKDDVSSKEDMYVVSSKENICVVSSKDEMYTVSSKEDKYTSSIEDTLPNKNILEDKSIVIHQRAATHTKEDIPNETNLNLSSRAETANQVPLIDHNEKSDNKDNKVPVLVINQPTITVLPNEENKQINKNSTSAKRKSIDDISKRLMEDKQTNFAVLNSDDLKIHLKKISEIDTSVTDDNVKKMFLKRVSKRKRFKSFDDYTVYNQKFSDDGIPKLIIKKKCV